MRVSHSTWVTLSSFIKPLMRQLKSINSFLYIQDDAIFIIPTKDFLIQMTINELTTFTLDKSAQIIHNIGQYYKSNYL